MSKTALLDTVKDISAEVDAAQVDSTFTESKQQSMKGIVSAAVSGNPERQRKFAETTAVLGGVLSGRLPEHMLKEAMTTSDFPILFGDVMDRLLLAGYRAAPSTFEAYTRTTTVRDFREVKRKYVDGADGLLNRVEEQAEYEADSVDEGEYTYRVHKYGKILPFSWETFINDDLDALADMPQRLGRGAARSEQDFATRLYTGSGGLSSFFSESNGNIVEGHPILNMEGLLKAFEQMSHQRDPNNDMPILNNPQYLVVPPELEIIARQLINATEIRMQEGDNTIISRNYLNGSLQIIVDRHIPIVTGGSVSPWFLFADPNDGRGAMEFARLRGHEEPEVFVKTPNAQRAGGGDVGYQQGDFNTDSIIYKIRHVFGGTTMDPLYVVGSNGTGGS